MIRIIITIILKLVCYHLLVYHLKYIPDLWDKPHLHCLHHDNYKPPCGLTLTLLVRPSIQWLTIVVRVRVCEGGDADEDLAVVSLNHQLQFPSGLFYQLPSVMQREVLCHCAIDLRTGTYTYTEYTQSETVGAWVMHGDIVYILT